MSHTVNKVVEKYGITLTITDGPHDTTDEDGWEHWAYEVALTYSAPGHDTALKAPRCWSDIAWRQGTGITDDPGAATVLDSLRLDARLGQESFEDFCGELGYDTDSRKAYATWEECREHARKLDDWAYSQEMLDDINEAEPM